jgi:hypothetical protein
MKCLRKIGLLVASAILTCMGLSSCVRIIQPLEYGVPYEGPLVSDSSGVSVNATDNGNSTKDNK